MKVAGSYDSLIRGVSQQSPEVRLAGQHTEQVNMLSDPVAGLTRRKGSILKKAAVQTFTDAALTVATAGGYRTVRHSTGGKEYIILLRDTASPSPVANSLKSVLCYNLTDHLWLPVNFNGAQTWNTTLTQNGVSAAVSIGQYLMFGINNTLCSKVDSAVWGLAANLKTVVWVRGGAYNRTYTVTAPGGVSFSYTTPDASAGGAAAAIVPSAIAAQLAAAAVAAGAAGSVSVGSHLYIPIAVYVAGYDVAVSDGGDGSLMRGVYATIDSVDDLPIMGIDGQVVKVQPSSDTWFYMKAYSKGAVATLNEVLWREAPGENQATALYGLGIARIYNGALYVGVTAAGDPNGLAHLTAAGLSDVIPTVVASIAGDAATNVAPRWMTNQITYMGMFQDRLLIGSVAAQAVSGAGDYLNFFRSTMTTVPAKDGFEMIAQGGEDDTLRHSVAYNKNLVIFGNKRQYFISGTTPLTPSSANMSIMTVYADAAECSPVAAGGQIYYARNAEGSVGLYQIQPGAYVDSAESFPSSAQIGSYIPAPAAEIEPVSGTPGLLVVRSRSQPRNLYVFSYLDQPDGRKQDAWYKWDFDAGNGNLLSSVSTPSGLLLMWARIGKAGDVYLVADLMPLSTATAPTMPYLDSTRLHSTVGASEMPVGGAGWDAAFDSQTDRFLIGEDYDDTVGMAALAAEYPAEMPTLWVGLPYDAYVIPTNPYARDKDDKAILTGRTVVTKLGVNTRLSSGMDWDLSAGGIVKAGSFNGRRIGDPLNLIGTVPVSSTVVQVPIGRETRAYSIKLKARKWFPLNLIGIEWTGQSFNRTPRA